MQYRYISFFAIIIGLSAGCSSVAPEQAVDYAGEQQAVRDLVIPPDLTAAPLSPLLVIPDLPDNNVGQPGVDANLHQTVTADEPQLTPARADEAHSPQTPEPALTPQSRRSVPNTPHLLLPSAQHQAWAQVLSFWQAQGVELIEQNEQLGVLRTDWIADHSNTADDVIADVFRLVLGNLYEPDHRSQYLMRLAPIDNQQTVVSVTHYGTRQTVHYDISGDIDKTRWEPRATDIRHAYELLNQIAAYLNVSPPIQPPPSEVVEVSTPFLDGELTITNPVAEAWPLLAHALHQPMFQIQQQDQNAGQFVVQYPVSPKKFTLSPGLTFSVGDSDTSETSAESYQIMLRPTQTGSVIQVRSHQGQVVHHAHSAQLLHQIAGYFQVHR